jgi:protein tyrosine phosphatase
MMSYEDMEREFLDFKTAFRSENTSVSQLAENRGKNRYMNVLPNDNSRVKLINSENNYINANYISIKGSGVNYK